MGFWGSSPNKGVFILLPVSGNQYTESVPKHGHQNPKTGKEARK